MGRHYTDSDTLFTVIVGSDLSVVGFLPSFAFVLVFFSLIFHVCFTYGENKIAAN